MALHLGKLPPRLDSRTLALANYLRPQTNTPSVNLSCSSHAPDCHPERSASCEAEGSRLDAFALSSEKGIAFPAKRALAPAPSSVDWTAKISVWPMFANDTLGDCTTAAAAHMIECWTANSGGAFTPATAQVIAAYSATGNYIPGDAATDNGAVELDVLNYWRQQGIAGHKISAYVSLRAQNFEHARQAIFLFGGIYIGLALPLSAREQDVWSILPWWKRIGTTTQTAPGSWGGHAVPALAYDSAGLTCITWGAKKRMTWDFFARYCDESYAPLSRDWLNARGTDPSGFDFAQLDSDLSALAASPALKSAALPETPLPEKLLTSSFRL